MGRSGGHGRSGRRPQAGDAHPLQPDTPRGVRTLRRLRSAGIQGPRDSEALRPKEILFELKSAPPGRPNISTVRDPAFTVPAGPWSGSGNTKIQLPLPIASRLRCAGFGAKPNWGAETRPIDSRTGSVGD